MNNKLNKYSIREAVFKIIGDHLGIPSSTLSESDDIMDDLGADDYDKLELIMTIEELFDVKLIPEQIKSKNKISDLIIVLEELFPPNFEIML